MIMTRSCRSICGVTITCNPKRIASFRRPWMRTKNLYSWSSSLRTYGPSTRLMRIRIPINFLRCRNHSVLSHHLLHRYCVHHSYARPCWVDGFRWIRSSYRPLLISYPVRKMHKRIDLWCWARRSTSSYPSMSSTKRVSRNCTLSTRNCNTPFRPVNKMVHLWSSYPKWSPFHQSVSMRWAWISNPPHKSFMDLLGSFLVHWGVDRWSTWLDLNLRPSYPATFYKSRAVIPI